MVIELCRFDHGEEKLWDEYVYRHPSACHSHLSAWRRVIQGSYHHRPFYLWAHENGQTKGILPLILIRSILFDRSLVSLPFLDDGGISADDDRTKSDLYHGALRLCEDHKVDFLDLRHRQLSGLDLPSHGRKVTLMLELSSDPERTWKRFDGNIRNKIQKALRSGLTASWNGAEGLADFYDVFATNMRDLGSPAHSRRFFAAILDEFSDSARLILVRKGSQTIGGGLCLLFRDTILTPWFSTRREYSSTCPNYLLNWEVIRWGCEKGYRRFDFGRSSPGSGTYRFKKQWGAVEEPLHWQCLKRKSDRTPLVDSDDPRYRWAIRIWKRLPLAVTKLIGPRLRRQISN